MYNYRGSREQLNLSRSRYPLKIYFHCIVAPSLSDLADRDNSSFFLPLFAIARHDALHALIVCRLIIRKRTNQRPRKCDFLQAGRGGAGRWKLRRACTRARNREREEIEDVYWIRPRSAMNQAANWNFPPNKSPFYILCSYVPRRIQTYTIFIYIYISMHPYHESIGIASSLVGSLSRKGNIVSCVTVEPITPERSSG